jgi:hypothetical protein
MIAVTDLKNVHYMVDDHGKPTAAVVDIQLWESLLEWLEDEADVRLAKERLAGWPTKDGWTPWDAFEAELDLP